MIENRENIDKIFSEIFENYQKDITEDYWSEISPVLKRQNFMKFGFYHFNVYYIFIMVSLISFSIYLSTDYKHFNEKPIDKKISSTTDISLLPLEIKSNTSSRRIENEAQNSLYNSGSSVLTQNDNLSSKFDQVKEADTLTKIENNLTSSLNSNETKKNDSVFVSYKTLYFKNIIPNGSFEEENNLLFTDNSKTWKVFFTDDSPETFCFNEQKTKEFFSTYQGNVIPLSGNCIVGLFVYRVDPALNYQNVREFIYEKLDIPLKKDSVYLIDLNIFLDAESNVSLKNFDIYFSKNKIEANNLKKVFRMVPQISFDKTFPENSKWTQLQSEYKASGNENYIALGNFHPDKSVEIKHIQPVTNGRKSKWKLANGELAAYYYLDDIRIRQVRSIKIISQTQEKTDTSNKHQIFELSKVNTDTTITVRNIYFEFDYAEIQKQSYDILLQLADALKKNQQFNVEIQGHTDIIGTDAYNIELSAKRARSVYSFLSNNGVSPFRMSYKGYGTTIPVAKNDTDTGRSLNRRVVFKIYKK